MKKHIHKIRYFTFFLILLQFFLVQKLFSQPELPTRSITVNHTQDINFGAFCLENAGSSGGTVQVDWQGNRSTTGQIILLNTETFQPAIFEIKLCQGRNVRISYDPTIILNGNNGGSLILNIGPTEKGVSGSSFQVNTDCNFTTLLRVGGTLTVGNNSANPGGFYSGNFNIRFDQE